MRTRPLAGLLVSAGRPAFLLALLLAAVPALAQDGVCSAITTLRSATCPAGTDCTSKGSGLTHAEGDQNFANTAELCDLSDVFTAKVLGAAAGGTGLDASALTGVASVAAGTWSVSGLSSVIAAALSDETGTGAVVLGTDPSFTNGIGIDSSCAAVTSDRWFGDKDCDGTQDSGEEFFDVDVSNQTCIGTNKVSGISSDGSLVCSADQTGAATTSIIDADADTYVRTEESADEDHVRIATGGSERVTVDASGNVGIGDTTPDEEFHLKGGTGIIARVESTSVSSSAGFEAKTDASTWGIMAGLSGNDQLDFRDDAATLLTLAAGGRLTPSIFEVPSSTTLPATCEVGDAYMDTDATSGQRFYLCESSNTWALQGDGSGGGSSVILDLGDDASNESTDVGEIATTGDTNSIFSEPSADKLLIAVGNNWPTADAADALSANGTNCSAGEAARGVNAAGVAEQCFSVVTSESDPTLTDNNAVTMGDGSTADPVVTLDGSAGTDGTITWDESEDTFDLNGGLVVGGTPLIQGSGSAALNIDGNGQNTTLGDGGTNGLQITDAGALTFIGTGDIDLPNDSVDGADVNFPFGACAMYENLAAADVNKMLTMWDDAVTITGVGCYCSGACTTPAQISLEDLAGNAMTHTVPTCATSGTATYQSVTAANSLTAGEPLVFDVDNAVSPETDDYLICVSYSVD